MRHLYCLLLALLLAAATARAQVYPNLSFEPGCNHGQPLVLWSCPADHTALDSTVGHSGRGSLRFDLPAGARQAYAYLPLTPDSTRGQLLTIRGWVRRQNWRGRLSWRASSWSVTVAGLSAESATVADSTPGTADWQPLTLRLPVKATAFALGITLVAEGSGRLWLDDITIGAKGRTLPEQPQPLTEALLLPLAASQAPNWSLERLPPPLTRPPASAVALGLDSLGARQGRYALRLQRRSQAGSLAPVVYLGTLPIDLRDAGKTLTIRGYWRRPAGAAGPSGPAPQLAVRLLRASAPDDSRWHPDTLGYKPVAGPAPGPEWSAFAVTAPLQLFLGTDQRARQVSQAALSIGVQLPDTRPLELDALTFAIDGQPYAPTGPPAPPPPSALETAWLRTTLRPLQLAAPATAATDVAALGSYLAPARLLGLGELSHGSRESFALHEQLVRYLVAQKSYAGLLLDADPIGCEALQAYVRTGQGDPARLLAALHDNWQVPEMLALLRWLCQYQQGHPATPLVLAGLDVRQPERALVALQQLVEPDDAFAQTHLAQAAQLLAAFPHPAANAPDLLRHPAQASDSLLAPLRRTLAELRNGLEARQQVGGRPVSLARLARRRYYLRLVEQGAAYRRIPSPDTASYYRQACLAENAWHLSQQEAGSAARLVLWANNSTVAHGGRSTGDWLRATLGLGYRALGTVLGQGQVSAQAADGTWAPTTLAPLRPGAYELWLRTGPATSWLPLGNLELTDDSAWLFQQQLLRDFGSRAQRNQYQLHNLRDEFEAVVYLGESSPTVALP